MLSEAKLDTLNDLKVCMSLRKPQWEALRVFAEALELLKWEKVPWIPQAERSENDGGQRKFTAEQVADADARHTAELDARLYAVRGKFPTLTSFEREFPSLCFALATGVGKTRLMAATIAYLHRVKRAKTFFVVAPNRTIYDKLKRDFDPQHFDKYVFSGLYDFVQPPRIVDGDNFENFRQSGLFDAGVTINVFNIAKLTHGRGKESEMARIVRLNEVLGQSYFDYLRSLPDLCVMMDESHHYHAEQGFGVINDLNPMIGLEFTATPQIQTSRGKANFKNVVYEYSLAAALNDKMYVKEPVVWTRRDFDPSQYTEEQLDHEKLMDGIRLHIDTNLKLDVYARNHDERIVKPFVLVVAKDTAHSRRIRDFLTSAEFFDGYYADKVLEIHSKQGKVESDENMDLLLGLESPDNRIEIVVHVNKLKEGWDVTNLYTIVPLRVSASETLTEQTIGRGLRLPYGSRTGEDGIDRLSIVSHDNFQKIVELANRPDSLVRLVHYIDPSLIPDFGSAEMEPVELRPVYEARVSSENFIHEISGAFSGALPQETRDRVAAFVTERAALHVVGMSRLVRSFAEIRTDEKSRETLTSSMIREVQAQFPGVPIAVEEIRRASETAIEYCAEALTGTIIPIPEMVVNVQNVSDYRFDDFDLDTRNLNLRPSDATIIGRELSEGGRQVEFEGEDMELLKRPQERAENDVAKYITVKDNIDYQRCGKQIFFLIGQAKGHFLSYLDAMDTERLMRQQARTIAEYIYAQMNEHFHDSTPVYAANDIRPFSRIEGSFGAKVKADSIYDHSVTVNAGEVRQKVFKGFTKACHTLYKFDSLPELDFARVLEQDGEVRKWLRPAPKQFNIFWGKQNQKYEPDFIVETDEKIYMVEVKAADEIGTEEVQEKGRAGVKYCDTVSAWNADNGGKPWEYAIVPHSGIHLNSSFKHLIANRSPLKALMDEQAN